MYTVLIQNKETIDSFKSYTPVFTNLFREEKIEICEWIETGKTIETALPELNEIIDGRGEWRAVIVRAVDGEEMLKHQTSRTNPFDFLENRIDKPGIQESEIPLIRLTHMLGGVPIPSVVFEPEVIEEEGKSPRMIYRPLLDVAEEKKRKEYRNLKAKYDFAGMLPSEVIVISLRTEKRVDQREDVEMAWKNFQEDSSSDFWQRNDYPGSCRFIYYDIENLGSLHNVGQMLQFWICVMIIASNKINASCLQAYRLYHCSIDINRKKMRARFERLVRRLAGAQKYIKETIRLDSERLNKYGEIPEYTETISVKMEIPNEKDFYPKARKFGLFSTRTGDLSLWENMRANSRREVNLFCKKMEHELNMDADSAHKLFEYEGAVTPLSKFTEEEFRTGLDNLRTEVMAKQRSLTDIGVDFEELTGEASSEVKKEINTKIDAGQLFGSLGIVLALTGIMLIPTLAILLLSKSKNIMFIILPLIVFGGAFAIIALLSVALQQASLKASVDKYNKRLSDAVSRIAASSDAYGDFLSKITSCAKGNSYLNAMNRKSSEINAVYSRYKDQLKVIDGLRKKIELYSTAMELNANLENEYFEEVPIDVDLDKQDLIAGIMENSFEYEVPLNEIGTYVKSPVDYISRFNLEREELYENVE